MALKCLRWRGFPVVVRFGCFPLGGPYRRRRAGLRVSGVATSLLDPPFFLGDVLRSERCESGASPFHASLGRPPQWGACVLLWFAVVCVRLEKSRRPTGDSAYREG